MCFSCRQVNFCAHVGAYVRGMGGHTRAHRKVVQCANHREWVWGMTIKTHLWVFRIIIKYLSKCLYKTSCRSWAHHRRVEETCCRCYMTNPAAGPTPSRPMPAWVVSVHSFSLLLSSFSRLRNLSSSLSVLSTVTGTNHILSVSVGICTNRKC